MIKNPNPMNPAFDELQETIMYYPNMEEVFVDIMQCFIYDLMEDEKYKDMRDVDAIIAIKTQLCNRVNDLENMKVVIEYIKTLNKTVLKNMMSNGEIGFTCTINPIDYWNNTCDWSVGYELDPKERTLVEYACDIIKDDITSNYL